MTRRIVVVGRDAALWLSASVLHNALAPAGVSVTAVELPSLLAPADAYAALPPLEALHGQLRIDEGALLRAIGGVFTLGQNFVDGQGDNPAFLHAYGAYGTAIDGQDFFAYWLKARGLGLPVAFEDFSMTAAAARQGRLLIPDDESERYGRSDYGYHLPARAYVRSLKTLAVKDGVTFYEVASAEVIRRPNGDIVAVRFDGQRVEGDLFVDATGQAGELIGGAWESWRAYFAADRVLTASGPAFPSVPAYAEIRTWRQGWAGIYPCLAQTQVVQVYASADCSDAAAFSGAAAITSLPLADGIVRASEPARREQAWVGSCVAIGGAACVFDPVHNLDLHAIHLGLIRLLSFFPAGIDFAAERTEYNRLTRSAFERMRDFQSAYYTLNRFGGAFWRRARAAKRSLELSHSVALFQARGEIAPYEDESFTPDSWRALFVGLGVMPASYLPTIDRTSPEMVKSQFRNMLGFIKEQVLRQPTHDEYLQKIARRANG
ncbi:tryptophan 7-halogenase [Sphingomonas crusticola]|uniref:tryptophan 7-halogenase n=1 Tax=Sphingomonas crusticola TaxID=1697973 RepID=UPI000E220BEA|nr:tryptophan 7-halogenase [Sphingomonas crusticola]